MASFNINDYQGTRKDENGEVQDTKSHLKNQKKNQVPPVRIELTISGCLDL